MTASAGFLIYAALYRLTVLAVGALSIWLGFRLFSTAGSKKADGSASAEAGGVKLTFTNLLPGTYFALFGTALISVMLWKHGPPQLEQKSVAKKRTRVKFDLKFSRCLTTTNQIFTGQQHVEKNSASQTRKQPRCWRPSPSCCGKMAMKLERRKPSKPPNLCGGMENEAARKMFAADCAGPAACVGAGGFRFCLLIYYAGHGYLDERTSTGYWQPVDAEKDNDVYWLSTDEISRQPADAGFRREASCRRQPR